KDVVAGDLLAGSWQANARIDWTVGAVAAALAVQHSASARATLADVHSDFVPQANPCRRWRGILHPLNHLTLRHSLTMFGDMVSHCLTDLRNSAGIFAFALLTVPDIDPHMLARTEASAWPPFTQPITLCHFSLLHCR